MTSAEQTLVILLLAVGVPCTILGLFWSQVTKVSLGKGMKIPAEQQVQADQLYEGMARFSPLLTKVGLSFLASGLIVGVVLWLLG